MTQPTDRVRREGDRAWIEGVPRLRWGHNAEPTYLGALEAAFASSSRPLDLTDLMGDSGLTYRVRWATRNGGEAWCGSGPCGEWPEEVAALNAATGYVFHFEGPAPGQPPTPDDLARVTASIDAGKPVLGFGLRMDMSVFFGYEDGGRRLLCSDYWANEHPCVMDAELVRALGFFLVDEVEPLPREQAVRVGLGLAVKRWHDGVVDPDPATGGTYYYGPAAYERWIGDLERFDDLSEEQREGLFFLNGWTYSSLYMNRSHHAAAYLRANAAHLEESAAVYDRLAARLGEWDPDDPIFGFVKQKKAQDWTAETRRREIALLRDAWELDAQAMEMIEAALTPSGVGR